MSGIYRFINTNIPTIGCNLRCEYCYIRQHGDEEHLQVDKNRKLFEYSVPHMLKALSVKRMGGICMFNISGTGETLLNPDIFDIVYGLISQGHYVALISNCTITDIIERFGAMPEEYRHRLFFKASFHYRELKKRKLLETYARNIQFMKEHQIAFSVEIVSNDYVLGELEELKAFSMKSFGALPHVLAGRDEGEKNKFPKYETKLSEEEFREVWSEFDSDLFRYQDTDYLLNHNAEFCYAGVYTGSLDLGTGNFSPCPGSRVITNFFEDIDSPIPFVPVAECPFPYCYCGFFLHVLAGVAREEYHPDVSFYQFRDRVCPDGSTWLTPSIREVFSHRCAEYHEDYPAEKKAYVKALMNRWRGTEGGGKEELPKLARVVGKTLHGRGIGRVAIYGMGNLGNWLLELLRYTDIEVVCGIDKKYEEIKSSIPVVGCEDIPGDLEAVIVSVFYDYTKIAPGLRAKTRASILSAAELV